MSRIQLPELFIRQLAVTIALTGVHTLLVLTIALLLLVVVVVPQSARQSFVPLIRRTNLLNWFYRALGVRVGRNVVIDTDDVLGHDLIELQDDCILDASCGVSAITFEAGKPTDKHPLGTMRVRPVCVGERAIVGPNAMVTPGRVAPDSVVVPCSATSNPPSVWHGSSKPTFGPDGRAAVNTQERPLGVVAGLAAMWITSFLITLLSYPVVVGYWQLFVWLTSTQTAVFEGGDTTWDRFARVSSNLECWVQGDSALQERADTCSTLMQATVIAMLVLPAAAFISGRHQHTMACLLHHCARHSPPTDCACHQVRQYGCCVASMAKQISLPPVMQASCLLYWSSHSSGCYGPMGSTPPLHPRAGGRGSNITCSSASWITLLSKPLHACGLAQPCSTPG